METPRSTSPKLSIFSKLLTGRAIRVFCVLLLIVLAMIVFWQNWGEVETRILFMKVTMPRSLFMLSMLVIGFLLGLLTATPWRRVGIKR